MAFPPRNPVIPTSSSATFRIGGVTSGLSVELDNGAYET